MPSVTGMRIHIAVAALALTAGVVAGTTVTPPPAASASTVPVSPRVPVLNWSSCYHGFQCATARVPLDYRHPAGTKIGIAVIRHLATGPGRRVGSLFVNGGGPGAQVSGFASAYSAIPAALRARFDIIDFDPRGFGGSAPLRCFPDLAAENKILAPLGGMLYPATARQIAVWDRTWAAFGAQCARHGGPVLYHDSTADVARDMDLLRQAVRAPVLNFVGLSYGTGLGATYASLFPEHVGHMVLDGNLDPVAWTWPAGALPTWLRTGQDEAAAAVLRDFIDLCGKAAPQACAFSAGSPAATRAKFATLLDRLHRHPVTIGTPPQKVDDIVAANSVPIGSVADWQAGAAMLQRLWLASSGAGAGPAAPATPSGHGGAALAAARRLAASAAAAAGSAYDGQEQALATVCADSPNQRAPAAYPAAARLAKERAGLVGPPLAWQTEPCAAWPLAAGQDRYAGPWNTPTANTILVLGNTGDPVTPYLNSVAMSRDLASARLLTIDGFGHTEFQNPSGCATGYEVGYLLAGTLPPAGLTCPQDAVPFP